MGVKFTNNISKFIRKVENQKIPMLLNAIGAAAAARSAYYTPIAYSNLINSQFLNVQPQTYGYSLEVGYVAAYAAALNNRMDWQPKPPPKYGTKNQAPAPAWNQNAKPRFLDYYGFESPEAQADIQATIKAIMGV